MDKNPENVTWHLCNVISCYLSADTLTYLQ